MKLIFFVVSTLILSGCEKQLKFHSKKWKKYRDLEGYPYREQMVQDMLDSKLLVGQTYQSILDSLGQPENFVSKKDNELWYPVVIDHGSNIDPVYTKHLILIMSNDSTIERIEIREWKSGE